MELSAHPFDGYRHRGEIEYDSRFNSKSFHVGTDRRKMNRIQGLQRLEFNNKPPIDQKIETMFSNLLAFIGDLDRFLAVKRDVQA